MEKEVLQQEAHRCMEELENIISQKAHLALISPKLTAIRDKISDITNSHELLYDFFFPLCEQLDTFFYDRTYKRNVFGNCGLHQKIVRCINYFWKVYTGISFEELNSTSKLELLYKDLLAAERLYERRYQLKFPIVSDEMFKLVSSCCASEKSYDEIIKHLFSALEKKIAVDKKFLKFICHYLIHHPPIVGRDRGEVMIADTFKAYVDIWSPKSAPLARLLYVHGWHDSPDSVKLLAQFAINQGLQVHAIHLPGHGLNFSSEYISIHELEHSFLRYYQHLIADSNLPVIVAGHSMGGAIIASRLKEVASQQLKKIIFFAPAFSATHSDLLKEKMPLVHKRLNPILLSENKKNLLHGGRGPISPLVGMITTFFSENNDNLYTLMQRGYREVSALKELPTKITLIYGHRDHCINYTVLRSIEKHAEVVVSHEEFDHGPHLFPVCGGTIVAKTILGPSIDYNFLKEAHYEKR